ncbi:MAG: hypothetical protein DIJKHBIC_04383 [Thermoanaerobaculia bacterium]|nr:hypothetical protein [Thermoanaerobaculia bacterium]
MDPTIRTALRLSALAMLYIFAAPVYLVLAIGQWRKVARGLAIVRQGSIACPHCRFVNPLNVLSTCHRCGVTEFGSRLYCSNCRQVTRWFDCARCHATIKVF